MDTDPRIRYNLLSPLKTTISLGTTGKCYVFKAHNIARRITMKAWFKLVDLYGCDGPAIAVVSGILQNALIQYREAFPMTT